MNVYKHYNQDQLNNQYNTRLHVPDYEMYFSRWDILSKQTVQHHTILKDIPFGDHPEERMDIFPSGNHHSKTLVFIHGGYWHLLDKTMFHFLAGHFLKYNVTTVLINYPLAPRASMEEIVASCRKALWWLHDNMKRFNGNPTEIYLLGHSAGGHLATMMLVGEEAKFVRAAISLSGLFRLEPVMLSYHNFLIGLDSKNTIQNSPVFLTPVNDSPLLLVTGTDETEEFKAQSEELCDRWKSKCSNIEHLKVPQRNHYSILDAVTEYDSTLWAAIAQIMNMDPETSRAKSSIVPL
jgi:arylformamidase